MLNPSEEVEISSFFFRCFSGVHSKFSSMLFLKNQQIYFLEQLQFYRGIKKRVQRVPMHPLQPSRSTTCTQSPGLLSYIGMALLLQLMKLSIDKLLLNSQLHWSSLFMLYILQVCQLHNVICPPLQHHIKECHCPKNPLGSICFFFPFLPHP